MIFEAIMLFCFGAAWPMSIYKSYISKKNHGKSLPFLVTVFIGYLSGITYKLTTTYDPVIYLYIINALMVCVDISVYIRNERVACDS
jgi:hypothetical protein